MLNNFKSKLFSGSILEQTLSRIPLFFFLPCLSFCLSESELLPVSKVFESSWHITSPLPPTPITSNVQRSSTYVISLDNTFFWSVQHTKFWFMVTPFLWSHTKQVHHITSILHIYSSSSLASPNTRF